MAVESGDTEVAQEDPTDGCQHPSFGSNQQHTPKPGESPSALLVLIADCGFGPPWDVFVLMP